MIPAKATTRLRSADRKRRILEAARDVFAARGYDAASVGEIAQEAGITKPVLYDHFASKSALYVQLLQTIRDELTQRSAAAIRSSAPAETRVRAAIEAFFAYVEEQPAAARVLLSAPRGEEAVVQASRRVQQEATAQLAALLAGDPSLLVDAPDRERRLELWVAFVKQGAHGLAEWWYEHPETPRELLVSAVMDVAWLGLQTHFARLPLPSSPAQE
jgi:AcrR family transcriptional regulator